ncbi:N-acetylneuraminate synthase family protein [Dyadobacter sp. CY261]|uniref:N-acetylneuraminate synthase family protein n=1 Tax=Dyadobacter sp. CY261 TaxID=2907203 RepID=UPI001F164FF3|nr:N-acetylneuraminate synthase family protein [Dyadobacter sp. CY261]MCF0071407.1 N-acetylneuraminate synthase family protein [Dyadobacter sp. CY261]
MNPIYIIGEIGQAHEGSVGLAHSYIDALAYAGVNAAKFQVHIADAESSIYEDFRIRIPYETGNRTEYWKRMEFSRNEWEELKKHCESAGLDFLASPFSIAAVDLLNELDVKAFKIGSGEMDNLLMLDKIVATRKPVILSSGMSSWAELDRAVALLRTQEAIFSILQCTTAYPTRPHQWGLNVLSELIQRYQVPVGFSDHSGDIFACLAAATLGARILEFHIIFDKRMSGPDASSSLNVRQASTLVAGVRRIETALNFPVNKNANATFSRLKSTFGKSLAVSRDLRKGERIQCGDLETKKPAGFGVAAARYQEVLGKTLARDIAQWEFLTENHLSHA